MRVDLNIPANPEKQEFLDQLNAKLRSLSNDWRGTGRWAGDETFRASTTGSFNLPNGLAYLTWNVIQSKDGVLIAVEVNPEGTSNPSSWSDDAQTIIMDVLAATLTQRKSKFFQRVLFFYVGPALDGEYWISGLRIAPLLPDDESPDLMNAERVIIFDMNVTATDSWHATSVALERAKRMASRLSLLAHLGLYQESGDMRWVFKTVDGKAMDPERLFLGFHSTLLRVTEMPKKMFFVS